MQLLPNIKQFYEDANGLPLAGGKLYSYQAGTTTLQSTYTDASGGTPNANPLVLDSNGQGEVWVDPTLSYKFALYDSNDVLQWTRDNVKWTPDGSVGTAAIVDAAVTTAKIADANVTTAKINDGAVTTNKLSDSAVTGAKIADSTITNAKTDNYGFVPPGAILPYGGTAAPSGFLLCDGTSYLRSSYSALFTAIGTAYGTADSTHFNVPDLRGQFIRGQNRTTGTDPDSAGRTALKTGGNTGDNVGSVQSDQFKSHTHDFDYGTASANGTVIQGTNSATAGTVSAGIPSRGGNETRPTNVYVNFIIKT